MSTKLTKKQLQTAFNKTYTSWLHYYSNEKPMFLKGIGLNTLCEYNKDLKAHRESLHTWKNCHVSERLTKASQIKALHTVIKELEG